MNSDVIIGYHGKPRCAWAGAGDTASGRYHDEVWGTHWSRVRGDKEGYLRRTLYHLAVDQWRLRRRRPEVLAEVEPPGQPDGTDAVHLRHTLVQALATLPPRQRAVLVLRYWEQLSEAEAAEVLGCSVGTVKSTASRGLARLRELTAAWATEDVQAYNGAGK
jgi:RNA polymerase sigma factor (sigma-70 family)